MKLPGYAIRNYHFTLTIFMLLIVAGVMSFIKMPRMENPEMSVPGATITVVYPGANPVDLEQLVVSPIEEALNELEDIKEIRSTLRDNLAAVNIEFVFGVNAKDKFDEVIRQVNGIRSKLPQEITSLDFMEWKSSDVAMMQLALISDSVDFQEMEKTLENLEDKIRIIPSIRKTEIVGYPDREVMISVNPIRLKESGIPVSRLFDILQKNNLNIPGGEIKSGGRSFNVASSGSYASLEEIGNTVVQSDSGRLVYLKDVAFVRFEYAENQHRTFFNGRRCLFLVVQQKEGQNVIKTRKLLTPILTDFRNSLPPGMKSEIVFDQASEVKDRINGFLMNLLQGILLVGIVILLTLGTRSSAVVIVAIPLSVIIGLTGVALLGYGLEQISIAGLVIALGLLVDNSIVMVENITRHLANGLSAKEAALKATSEIGWAIVSATLTTLLAFIPLVMMPDKAGEFMASLPLTVIFTLTASLVIALTLAPLMASWIFRNIRKGDVRLVHKGVAAVIDKVIEGPYSRTLKFGLRKPWIVVLVAVVVFLISGLVFLEVGVSFFPKAEKPQFMITVNSPTGSNIDYTGQVIHKVEEHLDSLPGLRYYASNIGHGNPRIYYNYFSPRFDREFGEIFVKLDHYDPDDFKHMIDSLRVEYESFGDAQIFVKEFEQGTPITAPIMIYVTGDDPGTLLSLADSVRNLIHSQPGSMNVENELSKQGMEIHLRINRDKAGYFGVPMAEIDRTIRMAVSGLTVTSFRDSLGNDYDMVLGVQATRNFSTDNFREIYVNSLSGSMVPLLQLATIEYTKAPSEISRYNLKRAALVTADIRPGSSLDEVMNPVLKTLENLHFPEGYSYVVSGEIKERKESFGGMQNAIIIAILAIFTVLVLQFRSFTQPLIIFSAIPLAVIGSVFALLITGYSFSFTAFIGLTSLVGIVINNSIILVDYTNQLRQEGMDFQEAVLESGKTRFTPILLTTLTTIGGLLPLTLQGGSLWAPLGWTIIGGLLVSTFLTLLVVPVLYLILYRIKS